LSRLALFEEEVRTPEPPTQQGLDCVR
jgi:hypothetical protein